MTEMEDIDPISTPRPTPKFYNAQNLPLSTKKQRVRPTQSLRSRLAPTLIKAAPKTAPAFSRFYPRRFIFEKAHFISFKVHSDSFLDRISSRHYNETINETYFDQCFNVERKLGAGSFGEVFRVRSKDDGRGYAVKRALERFRNANDRQLKLSEVQKHQLLPKHTNLVNFVRAWEERGRLYIQTELCEYSLSDYTEREHNIPEKLVWEYFVDLLLAVKHLHDHDLLHLDIKPENIFITQDNVCKLGDFGLIFDMKMGDLATVQEGDCKYLAPEMLEGRVGKAADIFSLGITILELACDLDLPSRGDGWQMLRHGTWPEDVTARQWHCISAAPLVQYDTTSLTLSDLSPPLRRLIHLMLNPDPERRPDAEQLLCDPATRSQYWRRSAHLRVHELVLHSYRWSNDLNIASLSPISALYPHFSVLHRAIPSRVQSVSTTSNSNTWRTPVPDSEEHQEDPRKKLQFDGSFSDDGI